MIESRQSYCKESRVQFFWPALYIVVFSAFWQVFPLNQHGMVWCGMVWYGMVWYGAVWYMVY